MVKNSNFSENFKAYLKEYCERTSIHGLRYFTEERTIFERILWTVTFLSGVVVCIMTIHQNYLKWDENAVIISPAKRETSIFDIPFPSVTLCTDSDFMKDSILNDNSEMDWESKDPKKIYEIVNKTKPPIVILSDGWDMDYRLSKIFISEGVCYSFNLLKRERILKEFTILPYSDGEPVWIGRELEDGHEIWNLENGYSSNSTENAYPIRGYLEVQEGPVLSAASLSLQIGGNWSGNTIQVWLDAPMNIPQVAENHFILHPNQSIMIRVKPVVTSTSDSLNKYTPKTRGCYFQSERSLRYFRIYTRSNCKLECLTNYTLHLCGCVAVFMPRENETKICTTDNDFFCLYLSQKVINIANWEDALKNSESNNVEWFSTLKRSSQDIVSNLTGRDQIFLDSCDCIPSCSDLSYESDVQLRELHEKLKETYFKEYYLDDYNQSSWSGITVRFSSKTFTKLERKELYGPTDFLGNFGGLLGLFIGFSVMSLIEIVYFFSI